MYLYGRGNPRRGSRKVWTGDICRRGSQPCGKCRDGYQRVCRHNGNNQYALLHQLVSSHSCSTTCCTSATTQHPGFHSPTDAACAYYHNVSNAPEHAHTASHPVPTRLCLSHSTTVHSGRHPNEFRLRFLVRTISTKFRPTPTEFIGATTDFPRPNWPERHPTKPPTHTPTTSPPTPRATTALGPRLPATSSR